MTRRAEVTGSSDAPSSRQGSSAPCLMLDDQVLRLNIGIHVLGRGADCAIIIEGALVSRQHAKVIVTATELAIEDLGSANGVLVNDERLVGRRTLRVGDRLALGGHSLEVVRAGGELSGVTGRVRSAPPMSIPQDSTKRGDVFELLGPLVERQFAAGAVERAEMMLSAHLRTILRDTKPGEPRPVTERAARYALLCARETRKTEWLHYVLELYTVAGCLAPKEIVEQLCTAARALPPLQRSIVRRYLERLGEPRTLDERLAVHELQALEKAAAPR